MSTVVLRYLLLLFAACCAASCATVIEGQTDRVRYDGGPGPLAFYDTAGVQIPSDHEYDEGEALHFNYIELDKRRAEHVITARFGNALQRDTLRRRFVYGWLIPDALLIYSLPVFAGIDILSSSIYSFQPPRVQLVKLDTVALPEPVTLTLVEAEARRRAAQRLMLELHTGVLMPATSNLGIPPAYGLTIGYHFGSEFWTMLGYNYSTKLEQKLGYAERVYEAELHSIEASAQYAPLKFIYGVAGVGFDHLIFQLASRPDATEKRFARNVMTGSLGAGVIFGSLFLEVRRHLPFATIETPEGPGQRVQFTHVKAGVFLRLTP